MSKKKYLKVMSPFGVAHYPHIVNPDVRFEPAYSTGLLLPKADLDTQNFVAALQEQYDEMLASLDPVQRKKLNKTPFYTEELDSEGNETGRLLFKFKQKVSYKSKEDGQLHDLEPPRVFNAKNEHITGEALQKIRMWGGSTIRVRAEVVPYVSPKECGLSLRLKDVQYTKLVSGSGSPFDSVEDDSAEEDEDDTSASSEDDTGRDF